MPPEGRARRAPLRLFVRQKDKHMTRDEFTMLTTGSERRIKRSIFPLGITYSVRLAFGGYGIYLIVLFFMHFNTEATSVILYGIVVCGFFFTVTFPWERYSKRRFVELSVKCPSCHSCLVFLQDENTLNTGRCYHCGTKVFDV